MKESVSMGQIDAAKGKQNNPNNRDFVNFFDRNLPYKLDRQLSRIEFTQGSTFKTN